MKVIQDMTDEEWRLHQARQWAAGRYRAEGYDAFAVRVERGEVDDCSQVRLGKFFFEPPQPHHPGFISAWEEMAASR